MGSSEQVELLKAYHELESWVAGHAQSLDLVLSDLKLALPIESEKPYTFHFAPDPYEIVEFGFSIFGTILDDPAKLQEKKFRDEVLRNQIARDFLFHGLPDTTHIVLLPPYKKELSAYLFLIVAQSEEIKDQEAMLANLHDISSAFEENDLHEAGNLSVDPDELLARGLTSETFEKWFRTLVDHFKNLLFVAAGWSAQGITVINNLFNANRLTDPLSCFAGLIDVEDIEIRKTSGPWLRIFDFWRKSSWLPNLRDARAIESIFRCNERLLPHRQILLLVSSTRMMNHLVNENKREATIHLPSGTTTVFLRNMEYFQAYKAVAPQKDTNDFFSKAYSEAQEQRRRLKEFQQWAPRVKELEITTEAQEDAGDIDNKTAPDTPSAGSRQAAVSQLEKMLAVINSLKDKIENVRYLEDRPEYAREHIEQWSEQSGGGFAYLEDILAVVEKLEGRTEWRSFLRDRLRLLEKTLDSDFLEFSAMATPYVQEYTSKKLKSFIGFPFRATVTNPELKLRIATLNKLADERYWTREDESFSQRAESVRRALQDLISCAMVLEDNDPDKVVVWAILFFTYGRMSAALAIVNKWIGKGKGLADESLRLLHSLIISRDQNEKAYADALSSLNESAIIYPKSALFPHFSGFLIQEATMKKLDVSGYSLERALHFCMAALEKVEKNTDLHAAIVNNMAYCYCLLYQQDYNASYLDEIKKQVCDLDGIVDKTKMLWKPEWLDTKGTMHLLFAQRAKQDHLKEKLQHHKGEAISCFKQSLDIRVLEEGIKITKKHRREAESL